MLISNIKDITKRMRKGVRELTTWKEALKMNTIKQRKKKQKLETKLMDTHQETSLFFSRAQQVADMP
jgi:hypothetical protein